MKLLRIILCAGMLLSVPVFLFEPQSAQTPEKTIAIAGLRKPVSVRRDERGIPYIEATNDDDLYFAQGYVTASDRLWQMDLLRRNVRGEMAEIFGAAALSEDKRHRTLGMAQVVDAAAKRLPAELAAAMNAYARGVNAYIDALDEKTMPPEFRLLQYKPRHWTPADSLTVGKLLAEYLSNSWQLDIMRGSLASVPKEKRDALLVESSALDVIVVGSDTRTQNENSKRSVDELVKRLNADKTNRALLAALMLGAPNTELFQMSNNWVVSGKRTVTGKPLLANDPHIPAAAPGIWYQTELIAPGIHVAGVTFPGAPGIVLGHNERIAWGATNLGPDVQDLYLEKFDKDNPKRYLTPSGWRDAEVRREEIKVRTNPLNPNSIEIQTVDVTVTRHGPIILEKDGNRYALRWPALDADTMESAGLFEANRARNWKEFTTALSHYTGPTQNFVYADVDGHIGYYGAGLIPIRKSGDGSVPNDGSTDAGEWTSFIPFSKLPNSYDPPSGIIVTANQRVVGRSYPYFLSHNWAQPFRARRIYDLLSAKPKLSTEDFLRIQGDVYSISNVSFAKAAAKILKAAPPADGNSETLIKLVNDLETWDGLMNADSRIAPIVSQMRTAFRLKVVAGALGAELAKTYGWAQSDLLIDRIIVEQPREWLPKEFSSYAELLRASYEDARQALTKSPGPDESKWTWGEMVKARFTHPLAQAPLVGAQFVIPPFGQNGTAGTGATVNVGAAVSMRLVADPSDWDKTLNGIPLGQSGVPNNPHWKDQLEDWRKVTPRAFPFSKAAVDAATKETVVLTPKVP